MSTEKNTIKNLNGEILELEKRQSTLTGTSAAIAGQLRAATSADDIPAMATLQAQQSATERTLQGIVAAIGAKHEELAAAKAEAQQESVWARLSEMRALQNQTREKVNADIARMEATYQQALQDIQASAQTVSAFAADVRNVLGLDAATFYREAANRQTAGTLLPLLDFDRTGQIARSLGADCYNAAIEQQRKSELDAADVAGHRRYQAEVEQRQQQEQARIVALQRHLEEEQEQREADSRRAAIDAAYSRRAATALSRG